jgi:integrase
MADTRYLKQRRQGWYFQMAVPSDVARKWTGTTPITISLRTRDLSRAQSERWPLVAEYQARFDVLRGTRKYTPAELEETAERTFKAALKRFDKEGLRPDALDQLADEIRRDELNEPQPDAETDEADETGGDEMERAKQYATVYAAYARMAALNGREWKRPPSLSRDPDRQIIDPVTLEPLGRRRSKGKGATFKEAAARFIEEAQRDLQAKWTEQTRLQYEATYRLFDQWAEGPTLDTVTRDKASAFLDAVAKFNPNWGRSPETKRRTFADLAKLYGDHPRGLTNKTLNRYSSALSQVFAWAEKRGLFEGRNPFAGQWRRLGEKRDTEELPYTVEELRALLRETPQTDPEDHTMPSTLPWLSWIGAYSGMRLNEICSLKISDVKRERGVWYFDVTGAKTEAGDRRVPIHSRLITLGILDYVKHVKGEWLFPACKPGGPDDKRGWYASKRFTDRRRKLGVVRLDANGKDRVDFHSFRRSVVEVLENARVPQNEAAQVVGHERVGITFRVYNPAGLDLKQLQKIVETIRYKGLRV